MSDTASTPSSKRSGELVEAEVVELVPELTYVSDREAEWHDARVTALLEPSEDITFCSINLLATGVPVEIKAAQFRLASGRSGRFFIRQRQHQRLLNANGAYLLAVYDPRGHHVLAMAVIPASILDEVLPDGWTEVHGDRAERGYRQLAWSRVLDSETVDGGSR
ncbi:hypothetical protein [Halorussus amylolyticus]|uniref:hypothetical protein n=1 Tax=Halorussus amylolyticus TaxID=1126242 RepID=UPI0010485FF3|nr:hypothetical protein [Halorussus amylolyticus]